MKSCCQRCWTLMTVALISLVFILLLTQRIEPEEVSNSPGESHMAAPSSPPTHRLASLSDDYQRLINLGEFTFLMKTQCPEEPGPLVVVVHSAPRNVDHRKAIRATWGGTSARVVFMLGMVNNETLQQQLEDESLKYGDLVQGSFDDSYRNLTYKHVMALKWLRYHCQGHQYVLKTDDDVFVGIDSVLTLIQNGTFPGNNHIVCDFVLRADVKRSWRSKWRVSPLEYKDRFYPTYCPGWIVLYSQDVIHRLYSLAQEAAYFWVDDVHVTGVLAQKAGVNHLPIGPWKMSPSMAKAVVRKGRCPFEYCQRYAFGPYELEPKQITSLWTIVQNRSKTEPRLNNM